MDSKVESIKADIAILEKMIVENDKAKRELQLDLAFGYTDLNNNRESKELFDIKIQRLNTRGYAALNQIYYWTQELKTIKHIKRTHSKANTDNLLTGDLLKLVNVKIADLSKSTKHLEREALVSRLTEIIKLIK